MQLSPSKWTLFLFLLFSPILSISQTINTIGGNGVFGTSGDSGQLINAQFSRLGGMTFDNSGNMYVCDSNRIRKVGTNGVITTIAGTLSGGFGGDGGQAVAAQLNLPYDVAVDASGNVFISDRLNGRIRKVEVSTGVITTIAGGGTVYTEGAQANTVSLDPAGIAFNGSGDLFVADCNNGFVRKIDMATGVITSVAGGGGISYLSNVSATSVILVLPTDIAFAPNGTMYIANAGMYMIRDVDVAGNSDVVAGYIGIYGVPQQYSSIANQNPIGMASYLAVDGSGNLYFTTGVAYTFCNLIMRLDQSGVMHYFAGDNAAGFAGDGGLATLSQVYRANGLATDASGNVYISDRSNYRIRKVDVSCIYPGQPGNISGYDVVCANSTGNVYSVVPVAGATSYSWTVPTGWIGSSTTNNISLDAAVGTGVLSVSGVNVCGSGIPQTLDVEGVTVNTLLSGYDTTVCTSDLSTSISSMGISGYVHQWFENGMPIPGAVNASYTVYQPGSYSVRIEYGACVAFSDTIDIVFLPSPTAVVSGPSQICFSDTLVLHANAQTGCTYEWEKDMQIIAGVNSPDLIPPGGGIYKCIVTNSDGCSVVSNAIDVLPQPHPLLSVAGSLITGPTSMFSYQWYLNGNPIPGATVYTYTATQNGDYSLLVNDWFCDGFSDTVTITGLSTKSITNYAEVKIFPNPVKDKVRVNFSKEANETYTFSLYNSQGVLVMERSDIAENELEFGRGGLSAGLYYFKLSSGTGRVLAGKIAME